MTCEALSPQGRPGGRRGALRGRLLGGFPPPRTGRSGPRGASTRSPCVRAPPRAAPPAPCLTGPSFCGWSVFQNLLLRAECPRLEGAEDERRKRAGLVLEGRNFPSPGMDKPPGTDGAAKQSNALAARAARAGRTDRGGELTQRGVPLELGGEQGAGQEARKPSNGLLQGPS